MDTICDGGETDTSVNLFGKEFKMPFFAGAVGAVNLHYSDSMMMFLIIMYWYQPVQMPESPHLPEME